jgi:hypothetical protein
MLKKYENCHIFRMNKFNYKTFLINKYQIKFVILKKFKWIFNKNLKLFRLPIFKKWNKYKN